MMVIKYSSVMTVVHFIVRHMKFNRFLHPNEILVHFILRQIKFNRFSHPNEVLQGFISHISAPTEGLSKL